MELSVIFVVMQFYLKSKRKAKSEDEKYAYFLLIF